jgi:hypothetical protein
VKEVKCQNCGTLFGKESNGVLAIKYRDLYRSAEGGKVWGPCRGCGNVVEWPEKAKEIR